MRTEPSDVTTPLEALPMSTTSIDASRTTALQRGGMAEQKLAEFMGQAVNDLAGAISEVMVHLGDELGLYRAMAGARPLSAAELAERTGCDDPHVREWLNDSARPYSVKSDNLWRFADHPERRSIELYPMGENRSALRSPREAEDEHR
jgi:hypothetical protein